MGGLSPSPNQAGGLGHYSSVPIPLSYRALLPFIMNQSSENIVTRSSNHCSRRNHTPVDLLAMRAPHLRPGSLLPPSYPMYPGVSNGLVLLIKKSLRVDTTTLGALLRSIVPPVMIAPENPSAGSDRYFHDSFLPLPDRACRAWGKRCAERSRRLGRG